MLFKTLGIAATLLLIAATVCTGAKVERTEKPYDRNEWLTLPTGRQLPLKDAVAHMGNGAPAEIVKRLYEIVGSRFLHGPALSVDLHAITTQPKRQLSHTPVSVMENGRVVDQKDDSSVILRVGRHISVAMDVDGNILSVWLRSQHLIPLDMARHPGVLVASRPHIDVSQSDAIPIPLNITSAGTRAGSNNPTEKNKEDVLRFINFPFNLPPKKTKKEEPEKEIKKKKKKKKKTKKATNKKQKKKIRKKQTNKKPKRKISKNRNVGFPQSVPSASSSFTSCRNASPVRVLEVAVAFDNAYCARYGNSRSRAVAAVRSVVAHAETPFRTSCIRFELSNVEAHCSDPFDPYSSLDGQDSRVILESMRKYWMQNRNNIRRDAAVLFTGFTDRTAVAGAAFTGASCTFNYAYAWVELGNSFVLAHELGHTLNARHSEEGLMMATLGANPEMVFSSATIQEIASFIDYGESRTACITGRGTQEPLHTPPPPVRYCDSGLSGSLALVCTTMAAGTFRSAVGSVQVSISQQYGRFDLIMLATDGAIIYSYRRRLSMNPSLSRANIGSRYVLRTGAASVTSKWSVSNILLPATGSTCCAARLYAYLEIRMCNRSGTCATGYGIFHVSVSCTDVCRGLTLIPMSSSLECPACK